MTNQAKSLFLFSSNPSNLSFPSQKNVLLKEDHCVRKTSQAAYFPVTSEQFSDTVAHFDLSIVVLTQGFSGSLPSSPPPPHAQSPGAHFRKIHIFRDPNRYFCSICLRSIVILYLKKPPQLPKMFPKYSHFMQSVTNSANWLLSSKT